MIENTAPLHFAPTLAEEDHARADFYALLSGLYYAPPDAGLLRAIAEAKDIASDIDLAMSAAWAALQSAAAAADPEALCAEYDSVFVGTGKAVVTLYSSHYLADYMRERVLVRLRDELTRLGLARRDTAAEYEDHLSGLCEVMRHLIAQGSENSALNEQKRFFKDYIEEWYPRFCEDVLVAGGTGFYKHVARFTRAFFDIEKQSLSMI